MAANLERPSLADFTIMKEPITGPALELKACKTDEQYTIYAINKLLETKSNMVMFILDEYKDALRLISPKMIQDEWAKTKAAWDLDNSTHESAVAAYLFFPGGQAEQGVFEQVDGAQEVNHQPICTACKNPQGSGPFKECVSMAVECHDFLKGACTNCYYKLSTQNCSHYKAARDRENKRKRNAEGGFKGIPNKVLSEATEDDLRSLVEVMHKRKARLLEDKAREETPRKRQKK